MAVVKDAIEATVDIEENKKFGKGVFDGLKYLVPGYSSIKLVKYIDFNPEKRNSYGFWDIMSNYFEQTFPIVAAVSLLAEEYVSSELGWKAITEGDINSGLLYLGLKGAKTVVHKRISKN